jgi:hypothetical protein
VLPLIRCPGTLGILRAKVWLLSEETVLVVE